MLIMVPSDENECRQMLYTGYKHKGPAAVRYPWGSGNGEAPETVMSELALGKGSRAPSGRKSSLAGFWPFITGLPYSSRAIKRHIGGYAFCETSGSATAG